MEFPGSYRSRHESGTNERAEFLLQSFVIDNNFNSRYFEKSHLAEWIQSTWHSTTILILCISLKALQVAINMSITRRHQPQQFYYQQ